VLWVDLVVAVAIAVGLVGVIVPMLPGSLLVGGAIVVWALAERSATGWVAATVAVLLLLVGTALKWALPHRHLAGTGVPASTQWVGAVLAVVGFFVVPVAGLVVGFVLGVYLAEWRRLGHRQAWTSTRTTVVAVGLGILVELGFALVAAGVWAAGAVAA
jgi:uncharacterized protein YqgC (DUF456 family)